jgi:hypothetical protein
VNRIAVACLAIAASTATHAQSIHTADSLLERGRLERAESLYYAAARAKPRDPVAREALGRFLAARGAQRVAVTLFEEALQFGGDPATVSANLAPLYLDLGDYRALARLPLSPLSSGEKARVVWLESHPTRVIAPDSVLTASYRGLTEGYVGRLPIRINSHIVEALVDVSSRGITVSDSVAGSAKVQMFVEKPPPRTPGPIAAAADSIGIGRLSITNAPMTVAPIKVPAIIGLDVLARFAPTFDAAGQRLTLRVSGTLDQVPPAATVFSTLAKQSDWFVLQANGWVSLRDPAVAKLLHDRRWTLDAKRGQIVVE